MIRFCLSVILGAALMVFAVWLCVRAAGTGWALPVFFLICFAFYLHDAALKLLEQRRLRRLRRASRGYARVHAQMREEWKKRAA